MVSRHLLPLAMLYVDGSQEIGGITRFQKLVFLAQEEGPFEGFYEFEADKFGPFSKELAAVLDRLEDRGLIRQEVVSTRSGNEAYLYSLTGTGRRFVQEQVSKDDPDIKAIFDTAQEIKEKYNDEPLQRLLRIVYRKYPDYTVNSTLNI